jgi:hypothetical protein
MTRSPLAYPLTRGVDGDAGGAADLQTDVMRFMAILALCLVAIFALVQSIPIAPEPTAQVASLTKPDREPLPGPKPVADPMPATPPEAATPDLQESISLTRPKWESSFVPKTPARVPAAAPEPKVTTPAPAQQGFTLRFESDLALTRLVAASQVGFYAITADRAQRMTVSESRISFWDASTPNSFHEMEGATVPLSVAEALARSGVETEAVSWGVVLPGRLSQQLDALMQEHEGGALVIAANGQLRREPL